MQSVNTPTDCLAATVCEVGVVCRLRPQAVSLPRPAGGAPGRLSIPPRKILFVLSVPSPALFLSVVPVFLSLYLLPFQLARLHSLTSPAQSDTIVCIPALFRWHTLECRVYLAPLSQHSVMFPFLQWQPIPPYLLSPSPSIALPPLSQRRADLRELRVTRGGGGVFKREMPRAPRRKTTADLVFLGVFPMSST